MGVFDKAIMFSISGYWKDQPDDVFSDYLVSPFDDAPSGFDDDAIFYYGLSEAEIRKAIALVDATGHDFVITAYTVVDY